MTYLIFLLFFSLSISNVEAQIIMEQSQPVRIIEANSNKVEVKAGTVHDSIITLSGTAYQPLSISIAQNSEIFFPNGSFTHHLVIPKIMRKIGFHKIQVNSGNQTPTELQFEYAPPAVELNIAAKQQGLLFVRDSVKVRAIAAFANGEVLDVTHHPQMRWKTYQPNANSHISFPNAGSVTLSGHFQNTSATNNLFVHNYIQIMHPTSYTILRDTLNLAGIASPNKTIKISHEGQHLMDIQTNAQGHFATSIPLHAFPSDHNQLEVIDTSTMETHTIDFTYKPYPEGLELISSAPTFHKDQPFDIQVIAHYPYGISKSIDPLEVQWHSDLHMSKPGTFTSHEFATKKTIEAEFDNATGQISVNIPEPPPEPSPGMFNLTVTDSVVQISIYDAAAEDGDRLSVFLNDVCVIEDVTIYHQAQTFALLLTPGHNLISLLALNEGRSPPNTAAVVVSDSKKSYQQNFKAFQKHKESFSISYTPK